MRLRDGSRIAHVSTILAAVKPYRGVGAFVELKVPRADTRSRPRRLAIAFGTGRVVVSSFRTADPDAYRAVAPNGALALTAAPPGLCRSSRRTGGCLDGVMTDRSDETLNW